MADYTQVQFDRLPKWTQAELHRLKANLVDAERRASEVAGDKATNVYVDDFVHGQISLPNDSRIVFTDSEGNEYGVRVHRPDEHGKLGIHINIMHSSLRLGGALVVRPEAANCITVKADVT